MESTENLFNVVLATYNATPLDFQRNEALCREIIEKTRNLNPDATTIYNFPAFTTTGAECYDAFLRPSVLKRAYKSLANVARLLPENSIATFGLPLVYDYELYYATAFLAGGVVRGFRMATSDFLRGKETFRQFRPWKESEVAKFEIDGRVYPVGDLAFSEDDVLYELCSINTLARRTEVSLEPSYNDWSLDARLLYGKNTFERTIASFDFCWGDPPKIVQSGRLTDESSGDGKANILLVSDSLPFAIGRQRKIRRTLSRFHGSECLTVYTAFSGLCSGTTIYDGGSCVACNQKVRQLKRFQFQDATFHVETLRMNNLEQKGGKFSFVGKKTSDAIAKTWEKGADRPYEEFARATSLAIFDYMRKSRSKGFALSLSGGADSATIAALIRLGVAFACRQGSPCAFLRWLAQSDKDEDVLRATPSAREALESARRFEASATNEPGALDALERQIVGALLTTVYQATRNSGAITRNAAKDVAEACGATHYEFDVDEAVEFYKKTVADATGVPWSWAKDDLALQNIQARTRAPSVWLLANRDGRLLLSTGNRSEVACGYATMDGDTAGGLSPIAGIDKAFIRRWLVWLEKEGVSFGGRESSKLTIPALKSINEQQPTAELRPQEAKQTDEADLMPYVVLNLFERALIRDRLELKVALKRVAKKAKALGIDVDDELLRNWGLKFCRLWNASQWKRQRYAPSFSLDDYDLSPCSWARFPILSAGFQFEIDDLK